VGQTNAGNAVIAGNDMNAATTNLVGRGARIPEPTREADGPLIPIMLAAPLRPPTRPTKLYTFLSPSLLSLRSWSRSQRFVSMPMLFDIVNHRSARFPGQKHSEVSHGADPANVCSHSGASPHQL